jgi:hypothetical protein
VQFLFLFFCISPRWKCDRYRKPLARRFSAILFESFIGRVLYNLRDCDKKHGRHFARDFLLVTPSLYRIEYLTSTFFCFTYIQNGIPVEQKGNNNNDNKVDFLVVAFFLVAMCFADRWRNQKEFKGHPCC